MIRLVVTESSKNIIVIPKEKVRAYNGNLLGRWDGYFPLDFKDMRELKIAVDRLIRESKRRPTTKFWVIGGITLCDDIAPMFAEAPSNIICPLEWKPVLRGIAERDYW